MGYDYSRQIYELLQQMDGTNDQILAQFQGLSTKIDALSTQLQVLGDLYTLSAVLAGSLLVLTAWEILTRWFKR